MGGGLGVVLRSTLRTGWRGLLGLAFLIGVAGGAVLTGMEALRRTDSAFSRLEAETNAWDVLVNPNEGTDSALTFDQIAALPMVEDAGRVEGVFLAPEHVDGFEDLNDVFITLAPDRASLYDIGRPGRLEGRLPDPDAPDEAVLTTRAAESVGLEVGDTYTARILTEDVFVDMEAAGSDEGALEVLNTSGEVVDLEIVGIGTPFDEVVVDEGFNTGSLVLSPAFMAAHGNPTAGFYGALVDLQEGVATDDFRAAVEAIVPEETVVFQTREAIEDQADRAIRPQVAALKVFTAVAALMSLVIVGQAVSRRLQLDATAYEPLRALGLTQRQRSALGLARTAAAAVLGAALAAGIAVLASPIAPVGVARDAEPSPGLRIDGVVLVGGGLLIVVAVVLLGLWPAARSVRTRVKEPPRAVASSWATSAGLPPPAVAGTRFALDPGPTNVPTRSTLVGAATAVLLVVATLTFAASLDHFIDSPRLYGTPWDAVVEVDNENEVTPQDTVRLVGAVGGSDGVTAYGLLTPGQVVLDGVSLPAMAIASSPEPLTPTVLEGRAPSDDDEVALGTVTLDRLGVDVGDTVTVSRGEREPGALDVVGRVVLPAVAAYPGADKTSLGEGALLTSGGLEAWSPEFSPVGLVLAVDEGVDVEALVEAADDPSDEFILIVDVPNLPSDVQSLERVRSTPLVLAGLLTALIALTVVHALGAAVRSRRRDLAVLRTFGFTRRQVVQAVSMQATWIAVVGLVVGIPTGIVVGRLAWTAVVDRLGGRVDLVTPVAAVAAVALGVLVVANLVGLVPGLRAARAHTASILRTE